MGMTNLHRYLPGDPDDFPGTGDGGRKPRKPNKAKRTRPGGGGGNSGFTDDDDDLPGENDDPASEDQGDHGTPVRCGICFQPFRLGAAITICGLCRKLYCHNHCLRVLHRLHEPACLLCKEVPTHAPIPVKKERTPSEPGGYPYGAATAVSAPKEEVISKQASKVLAKLEVKTHHHMNATVLKQTWDIWLTQIQQTFNMWSTPAAHHFKKTLEQSQERYKDGWEV
eukprot:6481606-Amphidinium_carterae.2